jgi:long-subunit fatty acid transport protein
VSFHCAIFSGVGSHPTSSAATAISEIGFIVFSNAANHTHDTHSCKVFAVRVLALLMVFAGTAGAYPFLAPRPVPSAIAGPTDPHVAAIYYNPAALGPLAGNHFYFDGGARTYLGTITRTDGGGSANAAWADMASFVGVVFEPRTDLLRIGLSVGTPYTDFTSLGDSPLRYQARNFTAATFEQALAVSVRVTTRFWVGAGIRFDESWQRWRFDRDAALGGGSALVTDANALCGGVGCGRENPLARQTIFAQGFAFAVGINLGVLVRPIDRLWLALSYATRSLTQTRGVSVPQFDQVQVTPAPGQGAVCNSPTDTGVSPCVGNDQFPILVPPDVVHLGARFNVNTRFDIEGGLRWVGYGQAAATQQIELITQGGALPNLSKNGGALPASQLYDRGWQDAWALWISGRWRVGERWIVSPMLFFETSAMRTDAVNAAAIDAPKLDLSFTAEWHPTRILRLGGHVGLTGYLLDHAGQAFKPDAQVACVDSGYSVASCYDALNGRALPSADANYRLVVLSAGLSVGADF